MKFPTVVGTQSASLRRARLVRHELTSDAFGSTRSGWRVMGALSHVLCVPALPVRGSHGTHAATSNYGHALAALSSVWWRRRNTQPRHTARVPFLCPTSFHHHVDCPDTF